MKDKTKILLGVIAGAAAGVAVGIAVSDTAISQNVKDSLAEAGDTLSLKLQGLLEDSKDYLGDLKEKVAAHGDMGTGLLNTEG